MRRHWRSRESSAALRPPQSCRHLLLLRSLRRAGQAGAEYRLVAEDAGDEPSRDPKPRGSVILGGTSLRGVGQRVGVCWPEDRFDGGVEVCGFRGARRRLLQREAATSGRCAFCYYSLLLVRARRLLLGGARVEARLSVRLASGPAMRRAEGGCSFNSRNGRRPRSPRPGHRDPPPAPPLAGAPPAPPSIASFRSFARRSPPPRLARQ